MALKKLIPRTALSFLVIFSGIIAAFFLTRLIHLTIIPIFTDEAIYLRWAQIALGDPRWRFISLIDGKQPLLIWLFLPALKLISDPLIAGRLVSVLAGFIGMIGLAAFSWYLTKSIRAAFFGSVAYIIIPFFLMYDRLAIYDALFVCIATWTLFLLYLFAKLQRLDIALLLGSAIGAGLLTKSYAYFYLILFPLTLLLVHWQKKTWIQTATRWIGLSAVVVIQAQIYNNILLLSEFRHIVGQKNLSFIYSINEFFSHPLQGVWGNLNGLTGWLVAYVTIPVILLACIASVWLIKKKWQEGLFFLGFFLIPFMALAFFGKIIYPRFILFMIPPLLLPAIIFTDYCWQKNTNRLLFFIIATIIISPAIFFDFKLLTDPIHAPLPLADRQQLLNDWPAGYGIKEVVVYLEEQAAYGPITVATEGTFGLFPMALELYLGKNVNITVKPYWPLNEFPQELIDTAKKMPTFLIFKERQVVPQEQKWPIELIQEYQRGNGPTYLKFYRVIP